MADVRKRQTVVYERATERIELDIGDELASSSLYDIDHPDDLHGFGDIGTVLSTVRSYCATEVVLESDLTDNCRANVDVSICAELLCWVDFATCEAHTLLQIADSTTETVLPIAGGEEARFPIQDLPSRAALRELALIVAQTQVRELRDQTDSDLRDAMNQFYASNSNSVYHLFVNGACNNPNENPTRIELVVSQIQDLYQLGVDAVQGAVRDYAALADSYYSVYSTLDDASAGAHEVRLHAARLVAGGTRSVGGVPILPGGLESNQDSTTFPQPFCTQPELDDAGLKALGLLRESGISPLRIRAIPGFSPEGGNSIEMASLVLGTDGMAARLGSIRQNEALYQIDSYEEFLAFFGLEAKDFERARRYLAEEQGAFGWLPNDANPEDAVDRLGGGSAITMYAATANPPRARADAYYASRVRDVGVSHSIEITESQRPLLRRVHDMQHSLANLAGITDEALAELASHGSADGQGVYKTVFEKAMAARSVTAAELEGRLFVYGNEGFSGDIQLYSRYDPQNIWKIRESDLECALQGHRTGEPCVLSPSAVFALSSGPASNLQSVLNDRGLRPWSQVLADRNVGDRHVSRTNAVAHGPMYLVRLRDGVEPLTPGGYELLGSLWGYEGTWEYSRPLTPSLERWAAQIVAPSEEWCTQPRVGCAAVDEGFNLDPRLPLEDDLTDDGDAFENSWRRYLDLAEGAARQADQLGVAAFDAQLDIDTRAEAALEELEDICGAGVSIDPLTSDIGVGTADPVEVLQGATGEDPAVDKVAECLGGGTTMPLVALGSEELCLWRRTDLSADSYCSTEGITDSDIVARIRSDLPCPRIVTPGDNEVTSDASHPEKCEIPTDLPGIGTLPGTWVAERIGSDELLGFFQPPPADTNVESSDDQCLNLRRMRVALRDADRGDAEKYRRDAFAANRFWTPQNLRALASGIRWEAQPGTYSTLYLNDAPFVSTGTAVGGAETTGICGNASVLDSSQCPEGDDESLLCTNQYSCEAWYATSSRSVLNRRLRDAAVVARFLGQWSASGFRLAMPEFQHEDQEDTSFTFLSVSGPNSSVETLRMHSAEDLLGACTLGIWPMWEGASSVCPDEMLFLRANEPGPLGVAHSVRAAELLDWLARTEVAWGPFYGFFLTADGEIAGPSDARLVDLHGVETSCVRCGDEVNRVPLPFYGFGAAVDEHHLTAEAFLDGLELLCEAGRSSIAQTPNVQVSSADQIAMAARTLEALSGELDDYANHMVLEGLPSDVYERLVGLQSEFLPIGVDGAVGAEMERLYGALVEISSIPREMREQLLGVARDARRVSSELRRSDLQDELGSLNLGRDISNQITNCGVQAAKATGISILDPGKSAADVAAAAIVCANAVAQVGLAIKANRVEDEIIDENREQALLEFEQSAADRAATLGRLRDRLRTATADLRGALSEMETLRSAGKRALSRAMLMSSSGTGITYHSNVATRRRLATFQEQYRRARRDAIAMTFLAKRAIEQRFGVRLASLNERMSLVAAPATWEAHLCSMSGIDYSQLTDIERTSDDFADSFIGEYVRLLRNFVESYRLDYPYIDGADTAVVSLRDDVQNVRALCQVEVDNLLYFSGALDTRRSETRPGWTELGCVAGQPNCIGVEALTDRSVGPPVPRTELGRPLPFRVTFGPSSPVTCADHPDCGWQLGARYGQVVNVSPGRYRVSWYAKGGAEGMSPGALQAISVVGADSGRIYTATAVEKKAVSGDWYRYWYTFDVSRVEGVEVAIRNAVDSMGVEAKGASVVIGGVMLEDVVEGRPSAAPTAEPGVYAETSETLTRPLPVCEDTDGQVFREESWTFSCVRLCDDGFSGTCNEVQSSEYCYWETAFDISEREIEDGSIFGQAGFAIGNFNYRVDSIAVNFVGSAARTCSDSSLPSTCYNAGWIPYTLEHLGPYTVRNYMGNSFDADLYSGVIEHARGLAAERYITNPISGVDQGLISQYTQRQFRGRPLAGTYRLRIWEQPGVNFHGIEDVQLVLGYRYWTRQR